MGLVTYPVDEAFSGMSDSAQMGRSMNAQQATNADRYHQKAIEAFTTAQGMSDPEARAIMLNVSAMWEVMARAAEQHGPRADHPDGDR